MRLVRQSKTAICELDDITQSVHHSVGAVFAIGRQVPFSPDTGGYLQKHFLKVVDSAVIFFYIQVRDDVG